jgi:hypothetical protein
MFRFSIRDLLWLTILIAVLVGWWVQWRADVIARHRDAAAIQHLKQQLAKPPVIRVVPVIQPPLPPGFRFPPSMDYQAPPVRLQELEEIIRPERSR